MAQRAIKQGLPLSKGLGKRQSTTEATSTCGDRAINFTNSKTAGTQCHFLCAPRSIKRGKNYSQDIHRYRGTESRNAHMWNSKNMLISVKDICHRCARIASTGKQKFCSDSALCTGSIPEEYCVMTQLATIILVVQDPVCVARGGGGRQEKEGGKSTQKPVVGKLAGGNTLTLTYPSRASLNCLVWGRRKRTSLG